MTTSTQVVRSKKRSLGEGPSRLSHQAASELPVLQDQEAVDTEAFFAEMLKERGEESFLLSRMNEKLTKQVLSLQSMLFERSRSDTHRIRAAVAIRYSAERIVGKMQGEIVELRRQLENERLARQQAEREHRETLEEFRQDSDSAFNELEERVHNAATRY